MATSGTRIPSCGLMIAATTSRSRPARPVPPQLAQAEQHEDDAERVDLAPDDAVEPADRVHDRDEGRREGDPLPATQLADHRPRQRADGEVRDDRRDLDQLDATPPRACPTIPTSHSTYMYPGV